MTRVPASALHLAAVRAALTASIVAASTGTFAADLPSRVVTPVAPVLPAPAFSFAGPYIGVSVGGDFLTKDATTLALATGFTVDPTSAVAGYNDARVRVGGYIGYNYQIDSVVFGIEGDGAYDFGKTRSTVGVPGTVAYVVPTDIDSTASSSKYDASIRGRLGIVLLPSLLAYATGGVAFRDSSFSISCPGAAGSPNSWCSQNEFGEASGTRVGYTIGGGLEGPVYNNLVARIEYRYSDFGSRNLSFFGPPSAPAADYFNIRTHLNASTVTLGLAYKFDAFAPATPVVARY